MRIPAHRETEIQLHAGNGIPRRWRLLPGLGLSLILVLLLSPSLPAQDGKPTKYQVEAAYLFNFGKFVSFPENSTTSQAPFLICVLGDDPFGPVLDKMTSGETLNGRKVVDKHLQHPQEATDCSILFISSSEQGRLSRILGLVKDAPVLTVSDAADFLASGGMIQFVMDEGKVRFEVNLTPAVRDGLSLSSELLKVAVKVTRNPGQEKQ